LNKDLGLATGSLVPVIVPAAANRVEFDRSSITASDPDYKSSYLLRWRSYVDRTRRRTQAVVIRARDSALMLRKRMFRMLKWIEMSYIAEVAKSMSADGQSIDAIDNLLNDASVPTKIPDERM